MLTLAIETSSRNGSVALIQDGKPLLENRIEHDGGRHAQGLFPTIQKMLKSHKLSLDEINLIAVSKGPGSFTGLRIGITCAKTLAYAVGCDLKAVSTFDAIALQYPQCADDKNAVGEQRLIVIDDAQRGDLFVKEYQFTKHCWQAIGDCEVKSAMTLISEVSESHHIIGPGLQRYQKLFSDSPTKISDEQFWHPTATHVGLLGEELFAQHGADSPFEVLPFYLRKSAAEEKLEKLK